MSTLAEHMIVACAENRPPMLESQCMTHGRVKYAELSEQEKLQDDCDVEAINIILQGLPPDVYSLINHHKVAKDIWDRVNLLMKGTELSYQERKCKVYNEFHKFTSVKGETLYAYYLRFSQLINDMHIIGMTMQQVKLYAYLSQPERHANEVRLLSERYLDPLAFESGQVLDEEQLAVLADLGIPDGQAIQTTIPQNAAFQTDDLDAYDSNCNDIFSTKAILMANLSSYGLDVLFEVPYYDTNQNDMINQSVPEM
ncbi:hypothetical protein Tco_0317368 [Tanacetum coccineum]